MVHRTNSGIPLASSKSASVSCVSGLKKGDVYTHCFHGVGGSILDKETKAINPAAME